MKNYEIYKLISKWEIEALELVLGKCLADELLEQFEITGVEGSKEFKLKDNADPKWKFLIEGRKYQESDSGVSDFYDLTSMGCGCRTSTCPHHKWEGIIKKVPLIIEGKEEHYKESLLAYYVYYMWTYDNASRTSVAGEQKIKVKNSFSVSNQTKRISAFNYFWSWVRACTYGGKVGLHVFLKEHSELFPSFEEIKFQNQNIYGI
ncbi:hypothetical protein [Chryseobacterium sp. Alg-005]|uniref:hypothetical protein n=1 Tax=Chryseobacterium sp. Alg-005 TaxID=3159516 RepID=UPI0036F3743E